MKWIDPQLNSLPNEAYACFLSETLLGNPDAMQGISLMTAPLSHESVQTIPEPEDDSLGLIYSTQLGHLSRIRSIWNGIKALGIPVNLNPKTPEDLYPVVYCTNLTRDNTSLQSMLTALIDLKVRGDIAAILAGPLITPSLIQQYGNQIDVLFAASDYFQTQPNRVVMPAAPNFEYFKRNRPVKEARQVLLYYKPDLERVPLAPLKNQVIAFLDTLKMPYAQLTYSNYSPRLFKHLLDESFVMVTFSGPETQGISWAESWAMDVPTLMFDGYSQEQPVVNESCVAAPYLTLPCGLHWHHLDQLEHFLLQTRDLLIPFEPATWVREHFSYERIGKILVNALYRLPESQIKQFTKTL
jgi:hypothetical protein